MFISIASWGFEMVFNENFYISQKKMVRIRRDLLYGNNKNRDIKLVVEAQIGIICRCFKNGVTTLESSKHSFRSGEL